MKTSGSLSLMAPPLASAARRSRSSRPLRSTTRARLSYSMPRRESTLCPCVTTTGRCERTRSMLRNACRNSLAELDRLLACRAPGRVTCASPISCTSLPSPLASALSRGRQRDRAVAADGADARLVDLERVVVGKVAQPVALDLRAQRCRRGEALDDEARHHVVGLVARRARPRAARRPTARCLTSHQVPEREHGHHQQRQVGRDDVEQAHRPGRRGDRLGAGEAEIDRRRPRGPSLDGARQRPHRAPSSVNSGPRRAARRSARRRPAAGRRTRAPRRSRPRPAVTWCATARTSTCALRRRAGERGAAQHRQVGPVVAHRGDALPVEAEARRPAASAAASLSAAPYAACTMPRSAMRRRTAGESRPVTTIGTMPPAASSFRPWPSSVENALNVLAVGRRCRCGRR